MKKLYLLALAGLVACSGCTTVSLEQYTANQSRTCGEGRDSMVLDCLAAVADDPNMLPSFSQYSQGITTVTDTVNVSQTITWAPLKYTAEVLGLQAIRAPKGQWTVSPAVEYQQLEALQAACLWALFGPERAHKDYPEILGDPNDFLNQKPHFAVEKQLSQIPPGWVHFGCLKDVPLCARYKGHKGHTWAWVLPNDSESFAQFTLVLQDIVTLEPTFITTPPLLVQLTTYVVTKLPDASDPSKAVTISTLETRAVKFDHRKDIEKELQEGMKTGKVNLTQAQWLAYTDPWSGVHSGTPGTPATSQTGRPTGTQVLPGATVIPGGIQTPPATFKLQ